MPLCCRDRRQSRSETTGGRKEGNTSKHDQRCRPIDPDNLDPTRLGEPHSPDATSFTARLQLLNDIQGGTKWDCRAAGEGLVVALKGDLLLRYRTRPDMKWNKRSRVPTPAISQVCFAEIWSSGRVLRNDTPFALQNLTCPFDVHSLLARMHKSVGRRSIFCSSHSIIKHLHGNDQIFTYLGPSSISYMHHPPFPPPHVPLCNASILYTRHDDSTKKSGRCTYCYM